MKTADVFKGQRVRSTVDASHGVVVDVDYTSVKILWEDGVTSIYLKADGFKLFGPRDLKDITS